MTVSPVLCYVAGPYRDPRGPWFIQANIRAAETVALSLWQRGYPAICPHLNTAMMDGAAADEIWLAGDLVMLARCDAVVLVSGWQRSTGTRAEVEFARERGIPIFEGDDRDLIRKLRLIEERREWFAAPEAEARTMAATSAESAERSE